MLNEIYFLEDYVKIILQCSKLVFEEFLDWTKRRLWSFLEFNATIIRSMLRKCISIKTCHDTVHIVLITWLVLKWIEMYKLHKLQKKFICGNLHRSYVINQQQIFDLGFLNLIKGRRKIISRMSRWNKNNHDLICLFFSIYI